MSGPDVETALLVTASEAPHEAMAAVSELVAATGAACVTLTEASVADDASLLAVAAVAFVDRRSGTDASAAMRILRERAPDLVVVAVVDQASAADVIAAVRDGARDVVDAADLTETEIAGVVERARRTRRRTTEGAPSQELRDVVDAFLRDLVQTERRVMDLESELARARDAPEGATPAQPTIIVADADRALVNRLAERLEDSGLIVYAFISGEEAVTHARELVARGETLDVAVADESLPGISGLETLRRLRELAPGAPLFLTTSRSSVELAEAAADLGVAGYVVKPVVDLAGLVNRLRERALLHQERLRENSYLTLIKERHRAVLERYRALDQERP